MPRKSASHAAKKEKDTATGAVDAKSEASAPRRSGRAVTKPETETTSTSTSGRQASRSRRSSTAAQTAASVADSKSPKSRNSVSSRRDSSSPSDNRGRTGKDGVESPAVRVKAVRRNASRINYKESDGEEEAPTPKNDENFESNEEFDESDSDEKSKRKGRAKVAKPAVKARGAKDRARVIGGRGRKGRPAKKKSDEEDSEPEIFHISENSADAEAATPVKKAKATPAKASTTSKRGRKAKVVSEPASEEKSSKPSRRSSRAAVSKDDSPIKRPSRSVQAKRYTEEDEDEDIEELSDSKAGEDVDDDKKAKPEPVGSRKRKRNSGSEPNKRLKEDAASEKEPSKVEKEDNDVSIEDGDAKSDESEKKKEAEDSKDGEENDSDEAMEVDESDSIADKEKPEKKVEEEKKESKVIDPASEEEKKVESKDEDSSVSKTNATPEKKITEENSYDSASDSEPGSKADQSVSSDIEDSQESQDLQKDVKSKEDLSVDKKITDAKPVSFDNLEKTGDSLKESKTVQSVESQEIVPESKTDSSVESSKQENSKIVTPEQNDSLKASVGNTASPTIHSKEQNADASFNGAERATPTSNATHVIHPASSVIFEHKENSAPKANGAHDSLHNNASLPDNQNFPFPGRKYISNSKLSENVRQFVKDKTFSFLSYNMGESIPEAYVQKDKLLHELDKLQSHIICLQHIAKSFYDEVLEPSLDALGFKGVFSQPEDSTKGLATFYKSSLFRAFHISETSIKKFIDKELELSTMDSIDKVAVITHTVVKKYGSVLFTQFNSVIGNHSLTVANVQIPPSELSIQALQGSCLAREVTSMSEGTNKAYVLCGEFNMTEGEAPYQLLRDGYLSNEMIEELQRRKDVVLPGKENAALINLLWKSFQHPSSNLCSSYTSVLDHELFIPEKKATSPDLLWFSSGSLYTVGVLDVVSDKPGDCHFSLKADIAFSV